MYVLTHFGEDKRETLQQLIREYGFGLLIVADEDGIEGEGDGWH
ncbi:FMN-binding negative transcriptional regulator [Marinobacter salinisoli]|uniref:FMN-binding negative transcriptional regulator n=1 Tax=Marinobacter salinisoli TaxID=2769486 RepID=A0ABX7MRB3_9GAMM|nr:FMN-binding negative transcriptional regulator [Marinobacter salinisoli]QSP94890.1 FMN-binding negative transcriptional regulator [Marinobacter salinisoli]